MDRNQLVTIVAAIFAKGHSDAVLLTAARMAESLVKIVEDGKQKGDLPKPTGRALTLD